MESGVVITITDPSGTRVVDCPWLPSTTRRTPAMKTKPQARLASSSGHASAGVALAATKQRSNPPSPTKRNSNIHGNNGRQRRNATVISANARYTLSFGFRLRLRLAIKCLMLLPPRYATTVPWVKASLGALVALLIGRFCVPFLPTAWIRRSRCITTFAALTTFILTSLSLQRVPFLPLHTTHQPKKRTHARKRSSQHAVIFPITPVSRPRRSELGCCDSPPASAVAMSTQIIPSPVNIPGSHDDDNGANAFDKALGRPDLSSTNLAASTPHDTCTRPISNISPTKRDFPFPRPLKSHVRTQSLADGNVRHQKRLSLNIPIQPLPSPGSRPTSWYGTAASPLASPQPLISPIEETSFLARLAAQERRVLELRDELKEAEQELEDLKRQWAQEEATKQRGDVRKVHQLQPLTISMTPLECLEDDEDGSSEWMQKEMERRKTLMSNIRPSNRKVFSGSKHMRTLSLLSPERGRFKQPFPLPSESAQLHESARSPGEHTSVASSSKTNGASPSQQEISGAGPTPSRDILLKTGKQMAVDIKEGLITFFEDLRQATVGDEGINATGSRITESGHRTNPVTKKSVRLDGGTRSHTASGQHRQRVTGPMSASKRPASFFGTPSDPLIDIAASFWSDHGIDASPTQAKTKRPATSHRKTVSLAQPASSTPRSGGSDGWDTWESPSSSAAAKGTPTRVLDAASSPIFLQASPSSSSPRSDGGTGTTYSHDSPTPSTEQTLTPRSSADSVQSPSLDRLKLQMSFGGTDLLDFTQEITPRRTLSPPDRREAIPWPALNKLTPTNLRRTASHLMAEWERSLSPSPPPGSVSPKLQKPETPSQFRAGVGFRGAESPSALRGEGKARKRE